MPEAPNPLPHATVELVAAPRAALGPGSDPGDAVALLLARLEQVATRLEQAAENLWSLDAMSLDPEKELPF